MICSFFAYPSNTSGSLIKIKSKIFCVYISFKFVNLLLDFPKYLFRNWFNFLFVCKFPFLTLHSGLLWECSLPHVKLIVSAHGPLISTQHMDRYRHLKHAEVLCKMPKFLPKGEKMFSPTLINSLIHFSINQKSHFLPASNFPKASQQNVLYPH